MDVEWIKKGLEKHGKTRVGLAKALGRNPSMVTNLLNGTRQLKASEIARIAVYLGEPMPPSPEQPRSTLAHISYLELRGEVAAGLWLEPEFEFDHVELSIPLDPRWPENASYLLRIRGQSINRRAQDGDLIICLDVDAAPRPFQDGDWVVVERENNGLIETTVKRVKTILPWKTVGIVPKRYILLPDSDDPRFQDPVPMTEGDGSIRVRAFVLQFVKQGTVF